MKIDDVISGKFSHGGSSYEMIEAKINGTVVWPLNYTYQIVSGSVYVVYSMGDKLKANGSNYAYCFGNVKVFVNGIEVRTIIDAHLKPALRSGTSYSISGDSIYGQNLTTDVTSQHSEYVDVTYATSPALSVSITQEANVKTETSRTPTGSKHYGQTTTTYDDYQLDLRTNNYGSSSNAAPASGSSATLSYTAKHLEVDKRPWTQDAYVTYSYTSGSTSDATIANAYSGEEQTRSEYVDDTPTITGSATGFSRNGMIVTIASEGTTEYSSGRSCTYTATVTKHDGNLKTDTVTLYQAKNIIVRDVLSTPVRQWDGNAYVTTSDGDYSLSLTIPQYTSSSSPAPASGATVSMIITADHKHTVTTLRDWYETRYHTYTWSSGASNNSEPFVSATGTDTISTSTTTVTDHPTPIFSVSNEGFSFNSDYTAINIASRGTSYSGSTRSAQVKVINGTQTAVAWVYQAKNGSTGPTYIFDIGVEIQQQGSISAAGGAAIEVKAHSYRISRLVYDSGAVADSPSNWTSSISTTNCTADQNSIRGDETTFHIEVLPNQSTDPRQIIVTLTANSSNSVSSQRLQEPQDIGVGNVATLLPYIPTVGANKGKVYYTFTINHGSVTSSLIYLNFCYRKNGGSKQTVQVGSFTVSETSSPVLFQPTGPTIPVFDDARSVKAWFEVQSTGSFSVIYANETDYYTYVEFDPYIPPTPEPNT